MAPVNVELISNIYDRVNVVMGQGLGAAITAALNACGIPDPGFVGWVVKKVVKYLGLDPSKTALTIAICLEYAKRTNSLKKGLRLQNKCSVCHCKGHNKLNHSQEMTNFLVDRKLQETIDDIESAVDSLCDE